MKGISRWVCGSIPPGVLASVASEFVPAETLADLRDLAVLDHVGLVGAVCGDDGAVLGTVLMAFLLFSIVDDPGGFDNGMKQHVGARVAQSFVMLPPHCAAGRRPGAHDVAVGATQLFRRRHGRRRTRYRGANSRAARPHARSRRHSRRRIRPGQVPACSISISRPISPNLGRAGAKPGLHIVDHLLFRVAEIDGEDDLAETMLREFG